MGRPDFGRPATPPVPHHLHDDSNAVDGDTAEGLRHGLPAELETEAKQAKLKSTDPLRLHWRVPLSWVHNPFGVLTLYRD